MAIFPLDDVLSGGTRQLRTELVKGTVAVATLQSAVSATGNGTDFTVDGYGVATLQITGTFVATATFWGSVDGTNFINIPAQNRNTGERALTTTTTGLYEIDCRGLQKIRASVTWTSGTSVTIVGRAEPFAGSNSSMTLTGSNVKILRQIDTAQLGTTTGYAGNTASSQVSTTEILDISSYKYKMFFVKNNYDSALLVRDISFLNLSTGVMSAATEIHKTIDLSDSLAAGASKLYHFGITGFEHLGNNYPHIGMVVRLSKASGAVGSYQIIFLGGRN